ncbi:MAG: DUF3854 domain-containing protein, partial [Armatimonadetes bacterium]|nr:DUF3854 domain-containing protein [Armatimonadota bacterium]
MSLPPPSVTSPLLAQHHAAQLAASGISTDVALQRGYWTEITPGALEDLGFGRAQTLMVSQQAPTLVVPLFGPDGEPAGHLHRPDVPRLAANGRTVRYEYPRGTSMVLDVPPAVRRYLDDPAVPLVVTEGVKKGDALCSVGRCAVALLGVDCWRGSRATGGRLVLPEWEHIALNGRLVNLAFDSDLVHPDKGALRGSTRRFVEWLRSRRARVRLWLIPPGPDGGKQGVDDYLAGGGSLGALDAAAVDDVPTETPGPAPIASADPAAFVAYDPHDDYEMTPQGLLWVERRGRRPTPLTNFAARVTEDVARDDGLVVTREYEVEATRVGADGKTTRREIRVAAGVWDSLTWVTRDLPAGYQVIPGDGHRDRVQYAIRALSDPIPERLVYSHLGWRQHEGEWVYLHGSGAIGPRGALPQLAPELDGVLRHYGLPAPEREALPAAVEAVLGFLDLAPREQTWPLLAAMWTAPLATRLPTDFVIWFYGPTGERKSSLVSLALCQYGSFGKNSLPVGFLSTANAVESATFAAKDSPLVMDDYNPSPDPVEQRTQKALASRIVRSVGNTSGRVRSKPDGGLQVT